MIAAPHDAIPLGMLARWAGGDVARPGDAGAPEPRVRGASIDTRTLVEGELFVPLGGANVDGHAFLAQAFERGAAAALCARERWSELRGREPGPLVVVDDPTRALQAIARRWREAWHGRLIGVTGSAGKTTTKNLVARALATRFVSHRTEGNRNNHWGVPLTLLALRPEHEAAVVEMGMNQPGEIAMLASLARPTAAVITNAGRAHLERFGSIEAIAREKASLAWALAPGGPTFAGADSPELLRALDGAPGRVVTYGLSASAEVRPRRLESLGPHGSRFEVDGFPPIALRLVGRHQVANALAAVAVARELGLDAAAVAHALEGIAPERGRMEVRTMRGATLLVDCYNANPDATRAALETLATWPGASRRVAVLGDMLELGSGAPELHRETGAAIRGAELWSTGAFAADYAAGAERAGAAARTFAGRAELADVLWPELAPGVVVLLKASRGAALEAVLERLDAHERGAPSGATAKER